MAQPISTKNYLVHDANGKPQVIKVVQTSGTKLSGVSPAGVIKSMGGSTPVRRIVLDSDDRADANQLEVAKSHFSSGLKIVRPAESSMTQKTIKLTPSQMQALQSGQGARVPAGSLTNHSGNTAGVSSPSPEYSKRRRADKLGKGLRHFSLKVCEKVRLKGTTTYNEVADELVAEFTGAPFKPNQEQNYDQKNIRRRVYDALNVLMAMNIISKEKKEIRWIGYPTTVLQSNKNSERDRLARLHRIQEKTKELDTLILHQIALKNLIERNKEREAKMGPPDVLSYIAVPFLTVNTNSDTMVNCSVSNDKRSYAFDFNDKFQIYDEGHVLRCMGLTMGLDKGQCTTQNMLKARKMVPKSLEKYVIEMSRVASEGDDLSDYSAVAGSSNKVYAWEYQGDVAGNRLYCDDSDTASDAEAEGQ